MSRKKNATLSPDTFEKPGLRTKIFVREDMIGMGKIHLLQKVDEFGSISKAATEMGIGYRRAWFLIDTIQRSFQEPILITSRGGTTGGATLTEFGKALIEKVTAFDLQVNEGAKDLLDWIEKHQSNKVPHP